jgi:hypothetical protein
MSELKPGKLATIPAGKPLVSILPSTFEEVVRFANLAVKSGLFNAQIKRRARQSEEEDSNDAQSDAHEMAQAQATMIIMHGLELGISPMQALEGIAIINGKKRIYGDLIPALLRTRGCKIEERQEGEQFQDNYTAHCKITRPDGEVITYSYSVKDAKQAKLWDQNPKKKVWRWGQRKGEKIWEDADNDSNWFKHPNRMLIHRARGFCAMDGCSDILRGLQPAKLADDEERFEQARDVTPERQPMVPAKEFIAPPPAPEEESQDAITDAEVSQVAPENGDDFLGDLDASMSACKDEDALHEIWADNMGTICSFGNDRRHKADTIFERHLSRVGGVSANA